MLSKMFLIVLKTFQSYNALDCWINHTSAFEHLVEMNKVFVKWFLFSAIMIVTFETFGRFDQIFKITL